MGLRPISLAREPIERRWLKATTMRTTKGTKVAANTKAYIDLESIPAFSNYHQIKQKHRSKGIKIYMLSLKMDSRTYFQRMKTFLHAQLSLAAKK